MAAAINGNTGELTALLDAGGDPNCVAAVLRNSAGDGGAEKWDN
jgi:hypothetical protein